MKKRTPSKSNNESVPHHSSEPDLTSPKSEITVDRVTLRQKRKHDSEHSTELNSLREDIMSSISTLRKEQSEKFYTLQSNLDEIKNQNRELHTTVVFLTNKYDDLLVKLSEMEKEKKTTIGYIKSLEEKVEFLERNAKSSSLEIRNVPKIPSETKDDLINIVKNLGVAVNIDIQTLQLKDVYRLSNPRNPQADGPITAEFTSTITKDALLTNIKKYNRDHKTNRLNSSLIKMAGTTPIFVSESLTARAKKLYYQAREFSKLYHYDYHWTSHGKVYIKKKEAAPTKRINQESDLEALKQQD